MAAGFSLDDQQRILDRITAYRGVCQAVKNSATSSLVFGVIMLGLWYMGYGQRGDYGIFSIIYLMLGLMELGVGLINRLFPSAEGVLLDGLVLIGFGIANLFRAYLIWKVMPNAGAPLVIPALFGAYWIWTGGSHIQSYAALRRAFNPRPTAEHMRWYSELLSDIRRANPQDDPNALDLPTQPPMRALLLGSSAFIVEAGTQDIALFDCSDVLITPMDQDPNTGRRLAKLTLADVSFAPFLIDADNWRNYSEWKRANGQAVPAVNFT